MAVYTPMQMTQLQALPEAIATAMILVDYSNPAFATKEYELGARFIAEAPQRYPDNALIRSAAYYVDHLLNTTEQPDFRSVGHRKEAGVLLSTYEAQIDEGIKQLAHDPEAEVFGGFLLDLAHEVAHAEGISADNTHKKVTTAEQGFIRLLQYRFEHR